MAFTMSRREGWLLVAATALALLGCAPRPPATLAGIRREIRQPASVSLSYLADLRIAGLVGLAEKAASPEGSDALDDRDARWWYERGLTYVDRDARRAAMLHQGIARFYRASLRSGQSIPYHELALATWRHVGDPVQEVVTLAELAEAHALAGDAPSSRAFIEQARAQAEHTFGAGVARSANERLQWEQVLWRLVGALPPETEKEGLELLALIERIRGPAATTTAPPSTTDDAEARLAIIAAGFGDLSRAQAVRGRATLTPCERADVLLALSDHRAAATAYDSCADDMKIGERRFEPSFYARVGLALEGAGDAAPAARRYREAIAAFERLRSSFTVPERVAFFRSNARAAYWGLVRVLADAAASSGSAADFAAALRAAELLRGRQFGELLELGASPTIDVADLRRRLGSDGALLSYVFTDRAIVVLALTDRSHVAMVRRIPVDEVEARIRRIALALSNPASDAVALRAELAALGDTLLGPVRKVIAGKQRLVVLSDGLLNAVPFDLLGINPSGQSYQPLLDHSAVVLAPSLAFLTRPRPPGTTRGIFAVGDPVYPTVNVPTPTGTRIARIPALPETRSEIDAIAGMFAGEPRAIHLGRDATESIVKSSPLRDHGILHFATHGILGGDVPGVREPALVLAAEVNQDSFLTATEVAKLDAPAELAVLSACDTGSGELVVGEGVLGLSRAFLLAGSRRVVVSLWSVSSTATEAQMIHFYSLIRRGMDAAAALRATKRAMRTQWRGPGGVRGLELEQPTIESIAPSELDPRDDPHPYYWAAFVLVGAE